MAKTSIVKGINAQIGREFAAAHLYLSMAAYFDRENLPGFARWMRAQNQEEVAHALRLFDYLLGRDAAVELQAIPKPARKWSGPLDAMEDALEHEKDVTAEIHKLYEQASKEKDYPTQLHLQWFITEQLEEEKTFTDIIARMTLAGDSGPALIMLDKELGARAG